MILLGYVALVRNSPIGTPIEPRAYAGRDGFLRMVAEILGILSLFGQSYEEQERLLRQLDADLRRQKIIKFKLTTELVTKPIKVTDYLEFNVFDRGDRLRKQHIVDRVGLPALRVAERMDELQVPLQLDEHVGESGTGLRKRSADAELLLDSPIYNDLLSDDLTAIGLHIPIEFLHPSIDEITTRLRAIQVADYVMLDRLFYLLTIAEESVSRATAKGVEVGDLVSF